MIRNTAGQVISAVLLDTAGAVVTTGTTTVYITGDGGTQASAGTATHEGNGQWSFTPSQANTDYASIGFLWVNAGAVSVNQLVFTEIVQQTEDHTAALSTIDTEVGDLQTDSTAILADTSDLQLNQANWLTATSITTVINPVTVGTNNDKTGYTLTQSFPANFASLGIEATGEISESLLTGTCTTLTGHTPQTGDNFLGATAKDNLTLMYNGVGYVHETAPSSRNQVDNIGAATGGALNIEATSDNTLAPIIDGIAFVGTVTSGTFVDTQIDNALSHDMDDVGNIIDIIYKFQVGGSRIASAISLVVNVAGNNDVMELEIKNHVTSAWDPFGSIRGAGGGEYITIDKHLLRAHTGTGAELGNTYVRLATRATSPNRLSVRSIAVAAVNIGLTVGYSNGRIWLDTVDGYDGSIPHSYGMADHKALTVANAVLLNNSLHLNAFNCSPASSILFAEPHLNEIWEGQGYSINFGGQDISQTHIHHANNVTGVGISPSGECHILDCHIGTLSLGESHITRSSFAETFTAGAVGSYTFEYCNSGVSGSGVPIFNFVGLGGASTMSISGWIGGGEWNFDQDCTASINVLTGGAHSISTGGGDIEFRGTPRALTVTTSGTGTTNIIVWSGCPIIVNGASGTVNVYGLHGGITGTATVNNFGQDITVADDTALAIANLNDLSIVDVDNSIHDALNLDSVSELVAVPDADASIAEKLTWLFMLGRNNGSQTGSTKTLLADNGVTPVASSTVSDDGTTFTRTKYT